MQNDNTPADPVAGLAWHASEGCYWQPDNTHVAMCRCGFHTGGADDREGAFKLWAVHALTALKEPTDA